MDEITVTTAGKICMGADAIIIGTSAYLIIGGVLGGIIGWVLGRGKRRD